MTDAVILIPPMLCDARVFAAQIADLSRDHTVIFAPTCRDDQMEQIALRILADAPRQFALAGAAMGGMVAMEIQRIAPERVTRLALINATPQADTPLTAVDWEPRIIAARSGRFCDVVSEELSAEKLCDTADRDGLGRVLIDMARQMGPDAYVNQARAVQRRKDQQAVLRKITQPTLVMGSDKDAANPLKRQQFIAEYIPYARLEVVANAGFMPTMEQPEHTSKLLRTWLRQPLVLR